MAQSLPTALSTPAAASAPRRRLPQELSILLVLIGIALCFEVLGWIVRDRSFLYNPQGLLITILQVSEIGLLAIGVTLVIIAGGIDLSSGSVVALSAMVAASLAQMSDVASAVYPALTDLPAVVPIAAGLIVGALAGLLNGALIVTTGIPAFIVTLGMMVSARGLARFYTHGQPVSMLTDSYLWLGSGAKPVAVFLGAALIFHVLLRYTRFGKCVYAIGGNPVAARVSGINLNGTLVMVYTLAGLLAGLGGVIASSRAQTGQSGMGMSYELDAIAAAVIGGTSLSGGVGRITGTVIGALILGVISSGFTFLGVDAYIQEIIKGAIIVVAVVADRFRKRKRG
ncbi:MULTISPECIES: ABC transporter permease [Ralstonia solanacearum species complex]|uniref:ABC transporter permease n=1 Tax=Ralstonia syzygii TaxID=28097 RepID=A0ABX7ZFC7_9RALS|nr:MULTISPECIES: ABC transporter permease [Ralstonia solanacearum species complex]BEU72431.1 ABC transporter permease [Ralstonia pseudosolanacearum]AXV77297.1 ABC transporter [Ralstonia solanacearum]AXV91316.1 ABC transporter [Ralstonia solanacearum]AXW19449.1 ABC transporter [Ralstonia solanacearum]AXW76221.1 ABC transporter [Ralstonia solanacearum]